MLRSVPLLLAALVAVGLPDRAAADQHDPAGIQELECRRQVIREDGPLSAECERLIEAARERQRQFDEAIEREMAKAEAKQRKAEANERERIIRERQEWTKRLLDLLEREEAKRQAAARAKREAYVDEHPEIDPAHRQALRDGLIVIGMPAHLVEVAWGKPTHVNRTITGSGISEQWVYGVGDYIYIENGRVRAIQTSR